MAGGVERAGSCPADIASRIYREPDPALVARVIDTHGTEAAEARWHWISSRQLAAIARQGRARTGIQAAHGNGRRSALHGRESLAVAVARVIGSMAGTDAAMGVPINATRAAFQTRGLDLPRSHAARATETALSRRINSGDETAVAERAAAQAHARAVVTVMAAALALVPQPAVGEPVLPPAHETLRVALVGLDEKAVAACFPDLPPPAAATEEPAMADRRPQPHRRAPDNERMRADHAAGIKLVEAAAAYGIAPDSVYAHWRSLGLSARGRRDGLKPEPAAAEAPAQAQPAPEVPIGPPPAVPLGGKITLAPGGGSRLDLMDLSLAVRLSRATGLSPEQAISWVRADITAAAAATLPPVPPFDWDAEFIRWMDEDEAREKAARARFYQKAQ